MSRVIVKLSYTHPSIKNPKSKGNAKYSNINHAIYIATRPGVDKTLSEEELIKAVEKELKYLNKLAHDEMDYLKTLDNDGYLKYIAERPYSHGLFGADSIENLNMIKKELREVKNYVWRNIISLREQDAMNLGYLDKSKWQDMLRKKIPDMAHEVGIPITNLRWVAAVHLEKGHPHTHIMFWEKEKKLTLGKVSEKKLNNIRKMFTDEIFEEERFQLLTEKNATRDLIRDLSKSNISEISKLLKEIKASGKELNFIINNLNSVGVPPRLYSEIEIVLINKLKGLAEILPGKGRVNLKFMPQNVKDGVRTIADYILNLPEFSASLEKNLKATEELTRLYTGQDDDIQKARDNAYDDIRNRVSQVILKGAVESMRVNALYVDEELSYKAINFIKSMDKPINDNLGVAFKHLKNLSTVLLISGVSLDDAKQILQDWNLKSNSAIEENKLDDIVDKAFKYIEGNNFWGKTTIINKKDWEEMFERIGVEAKDIPKWIYKGENWQSPNIFYSIINDIWKSAWREIERQRMQTEAQAEFMKKQQVKQQAISQNKEAMKEAARKNKDRGNLYQEDELDR